jgi:hypothetical protein
LPGSLGYQHGINKKLRFVPAFRVNSNSSNARFQLLLVEAVLHQITDTHDPLQLVVLDAAPARTALDTVDRIRGTIGECNFAGKYDDGEPQRFRNLGRSIEAYSAALSPGVEATTPSAHHRSTRFLRLLVDERRAAPDASLNRFRGISTEGRPRSLGLACLAGSEPTGSRVASSAAGWRARR